MQLNIFFQFGTWDRKIRLNITETNNEQLESAERLLTKSTLKVAVVVVSVLYIEYI